MNIPPMSSRALKRGKLTGLEGKEKLLEVKELPMSEMTRKLLQKADLRRMLENTIEKELGMTYKQYRMVNICRMLENTVEKQLGMTREHQMADLLRMLEDTVEKELGGKSRTKQDRRRRAGMQITPTPSAYSGASTDVVSSTNDHRVGSSAHEHSQVHPQPVSIPPNCQTH